MACVTRECERKWLESAICLLILSGEFKELLIHHFGNGIVYVVN